MASNLNAIEYKIWSVGKINNLYIFIITQIVMLLAIASYWLELADTIDAESAGERLVKHTMILFKQIFIPK